MLKKLLLIFTCLSLILICASAVSADNNSTGDFEDLTFEISETDENQTLTLQKDYKSTTESQRYVVVYKSITIDGANHTISAPDTSRVFWVKADNVIIKNINFVNSNAGDLAGGVISWWGNNGVLANCNFTNNSAISAGGAVLWKGNDGLISNCNFTANSVKYGASVSLTEGGGFDKSMMHIQVVNSEGGALYLSGNNINVEYCNFLNNNAMLNGGAISVNWGNNITITSSKFKNNKATYNGGAIDLNSNNAQIINSSFNDNTPNDLFNNCQNTRIINSTFKKESSIDSWYDFDKSQIIFTDMGYFQDLSEKINNTPEGGVLVLDKDYNYLNGSNKGILISKSITIDGAGHTLDAGKLSRMFNITADNVVIKNINFINGNAFGRYFSGDIGGGAIFWSGANGVIENCNFTNNSGSGIEDDLFDDYPVYYNEDGTISQVIRFRPMGAKTNEGGAIVWNGTNGTVSKCKFTGNTVGYPNTGGAICWRGDNGTVKDSEFYLNDAWCGSAIAWVGDNGKILSSTIANSSFFDGGIYWFGKNGTIRYSILLGLDYRVALRPNDADVDADYNFWGDTLENPNEKTKIDNVNNWLVMKFTHNGEFIKKGEKIIIKYDLTTLIDKNGKTVPYDALINKSGQLTFTADKTGFLKISFKNNQITVEIDTRDHIQSSDLIKYYDKKTVFKVSVYDVSGNVVDGEVKFKINKKKFYEYTNKHGVATLKLRLKPGKYVIYTYYGNVKVKNTIIIKKTLITKNLSKKVKKPARFKVKVLNSKGKAYKKQIVKIKFKGKTYKIKTNKKGIATFKVPKDLKAGKYRIKTIYNGLTNVNKIIVKK